MFNLIKKSEMSQYNGTGYYYRHSKTGMQVFCIHNDSSELTGAFAFATPSKDSTGAAHILEHTVLSGSGNYPVKDPFLELCNSSPNTFLNAMTFSDKTVYPFSSPLKKDFDIIFDIYADAVFNPLLRKESFESEGVRFYNGKTDGVVFNEMLGARSSEDSAVSFYSVNKLYKNTPYEFDSGGDPEHIADLTYEAYLNAYKDWYSPANCRMFLYGNLEAEEYLEKIERLYLSDEMLSKWSGKYYVNTASSYLYLIDGKEIGSEGLNDRKRVEKESEKDGFCARDVKYCASKEANSVILTFLTTPGDDPELIMSMSILTSLLMGHSGSPLYKAITDSGLGRDLSSVSGIETDFPIIPFSVGFVGAKADSEDEIEEFLFSTLKKISEEGFSKEAIDGAIKRREFLNREIGGEFYPYGISLAIRLFRYWMRGVDPVFALDTETILNNIKEKVKKGKYFEGLIKKYMVENKTCCLLTVKGKDDFEEELQKKIDEKYKENVNRIEKSRYEKEEKAFKDFLDSKDSEEALASIPKIRLEDLPVVSLNYDLQKKEKNGVSIYVKPMQTHRISYVNLVFDATNISENEKRLMPILIKFFNMCSTRKHRYTELGNLIKYLFGGLYYSSLATFDDERHPKSVFFVDSKILDEDLKSALPVIREVLLECDFNEYERIRASVTDILTGMESDFLDMGNYITSVEAASFSSAVAREKALTGGIDMYLYLKDLYSNFDAKAKTLSIELEKLRDKIINRKGLMVEYTAEESFLDEGLELISDFVNTLPISDVLNDRSYYENFDKNSLSFPRKTLINVSAGPSYNCLCFNLEHFTQKELYDAKAYADVACANYLMNMMRSKNGAYGAFFYVDSRLKIGIFSTYRDPNLSSSFDVFEKTFDYIPTKKELDSTLVSIIGKHLKPFNPFLLSKNAVLQFLYGSSDKKYMEYLNYTSKLTVNDMLNIREKLKNAYKNNGIASISSEGDDVELFKEARIIHLDI